MAITYDEWRKKLPIRISVLMRKKGWSPAELAERSKLNRSTVAKYLNGTRVPTIRGAVNMSLALGCKVDELIDIGGPITYD